MIDLELEQRSRPEVTMSPSTEWSQPEIDVFEALETTDTKVLGATESTLVDKFNLVGSVRYLEVSDSGDERELLVVSPYTSRSHLLDLSTVNLECQLLARALVSMRPVRTDYATAPYDAAFNWSEVVANLGRSLLAEQRRFVETRFYIVVFRSQVPRSTDRSKLGVLDELAHEEAMESGGLLKYWFGTPDRNGRNLATCTAADAHISYSVTLLTSVAGVWRHREDARLGGAGPGHAKAMQETKALYTEWRVERLSLNISRGAQSWTITKWSD